MRDPSPSKEVFSGTVLRIGEFRCPPEHSAWAQENRTGRHLVVFPRVGVWIRQAGRPAVVADPNTVMFYNAGCTYRRGAISSRGDECEWFAVEGRVLVDAVSEFDERVRDRPDQPFAFDHGLSDPRSYYLQRRIYHQVRSRREWSDDPLRIEEAFVTVLRETLASAYAARGVQPKADARRALRSHREITEAVKQVLSRRLTDCLSLGDIADAVAVSPFHLCRIFRRHAGVPIHRYRNRLRVREALTLLGERDVDLTSLGLSLGFSSHAHFTSVFKQEFGAPPTLARRALRGRPDRAAPDLTRAPRGE